MPNDNQNDLSNKNQSNKIGSQDQQGQKSGQKNSDFGQNQQGQRNQGNPSSSENR